MLPFQTLIPLNKTLALPVYRQIANAITQHIKNGILKPETALPGTREMAEILDVHRKTVIAAYSELQIQGWILVTPRKGFFVAGNLPELKPREWKQDAAGGYGKQMSAPFNVLTKDRQGGIYAPDTPFRLSIDDGWPDTRLAPLDLLMREYRSLLKFKYKNPVTGVVTAGAFSLREAMVDYLAETRGIKAGIPNLLITHGAQMAIYIAARLTIAPGSNVVAGTPGYFTASQVFQHLGANLLTVPVDDQGMDTDAVEAICKKHPISMLYVIPHHHHPTTVTLSPARRMHLLELSAQYNFAIIEDDYDYGFHYNSSPYLPLASGQHEGRVIYIGSFSKSLAASVRIGFLVGAEDFVQQGIYLRKLLDLKGNHLMEDALAILINNGDISRHLKKANRIYQSRLLHLTTLLDTHLQHTVEYTVPMGGMAIWTRFKVPLKTLSANAAKQGLYISDGSNYMVENACRIGFASLSEAEMTEAVTILASGI
ncbi:aminotransferase-like domain-containing protein [Chitinophaga sancti]|uniref:GntR family transcriptional regulator / MocR family aminotransferase n=1 Tax=Chitinophaga sancti TaxID=1004 RepID=A0A1K1S7D5_9BACT|nr:PLP-dependent aminotransferase family protein [Chitinophaga sancti]WQD62189.1 PLP-dependent aminotransferase family protein [Chitinophaga sancti]WQG92242.1 PLP-dependent aminotransferase family protein [Chitinophaga sancti]SFW79999.1 GntR family transcriptional regulator / MocR family aminotransferase [Chitinophaga sancti]